MAQSTQTKYAPVEFDGEVYHPISIKALRVDTTPPFDLYMRPSAEQPFVLYCERNTPFNRDALERLKNYRRERLFIADGQRKEYHVYVAEHIDDVIGDPRITPREKSVILYDSAQAVVEQVLDNPEDRAAVRKGKDIAARTVGFMNADDFRLEHLIRAISPDSYLYTHSVNVVAYSVALAMRVGIADQATLREIANGALLHDVGKATLHRDVLEKSGPLTSNEWQKMKDAPRIGYEMMLEADCVGEIALDIILHHRERLNGSGYPDGLQGDQISKFVRIVSICDIFDALTCDRHHQSKRPTFEALDTMGRMIKREIDEDLFRHFVSMMGKP